MKYRIQGKKVSPIDSREVGLNSRQTVVELEKNHLVIIKDRKSRLVQKDGKIILNQAQRIRSFRPGTVISLATTAPLCSKTRAGLVEKGIQILPLAKER